jgi:mRNA interferase MazF
MAQKLNYRRGDVALVLFPHSSLREAKTRPALVVQANGLSSGLLQVIVAMITSQKSRAGHPSRVSISTASALGKQSGLLTDSVVMTDNLATIVDSAVFRIIGSLPMTQVDVALRHTLGL